MPYITVPLPEVYHQLTLDDILGWDNTKVGGLITSNKTNTRTWYVQEIPEKLKKDFDIGRLFHALRRFNINNKELFEVERKSLYREFYIPKRSGGLRRIDAPNDELMAALHGLKNILERHMLATHHTSAFAYVQQRSTIDAVKRHQRNGSWWFLKTDFSDFFGNTNREVLYSMLEQLFPFCWLAEDPEGKAELEKALDLCFLGDGLPQGTPISPLLTNLVMIPIDHYLSNTLRKDEKKFVYTRYADDILISSKYDFDYKKVVEYIREVLKKFNAPYPIKPEKTRYGSRNGANWNLGVMLNKDNEITIGHKKKKQFLAMISNFVRDNKAGNGWPLHDVQTLAGITSYYKMVEKETIGRMIAYSNKKFGVDFEAMLKAAL